MAYTKILLASDVGPAAGQVAPGNDARFNTYLEPAQRVFYPFPPTSGTFLLVSGTAYFVYLGRTVASITPKFVELLVTAVGAGAQTAEVGLFSTPAAPSKVGQTLTKLVATATIGALTATGVVRNTAAFATPIAAGVHLWAGVRVAMATTQPTLRGVMDDWSEGAILALAAATAFGTGTTYAGAIPAVNLTAAAGPALRATLD